MRESRMVVLMQAAQAGDPGMCGPMNAEEQKMYDGFVREIAEWKEWNGGTLDGIEFEIPFSYDDDDDE